LKSTKRIFGSLCFSVDGKSNEDSFNSVVESHSKVQRLIFGDEALQRFKNDSSRQFFALSKRFENRRLITQLPQNSVQGKLIKPAVHQNRRSGLGRRNLPI